MTFLKPFPRFINILFNFCFDFCPILRLINPSERHWTTMYKIVFRHCSQLLTDIERHCTPLLADIERHCTTVTLYIARSGFVLPLMTTWNPLLSSWINQEHPHFARDDDWSFLNNVGGGERYILQWGFYNFQDFFIHILMIIKMMMLLTLPPLWINERRVQLITTGGGKLEHMEEN